MNTKYELIFAIFFEVFIFNFVPFECRQPQVLTSSGPWLKVTSYFIVVMEWFLSFLSRFLAFFKIKLVINLLNSVQVHPGGYLVLFQLLIVVIYCGTRGRTLFG